MQEIWKDVAGFEGLYQVSNFGRIRSLRVKRHAGGIMVTKKRKNGYMFVFFRINNKRIWKSIHRIVANAFIPNPENKPQVDHIDGNPSNNNVTNLRWATNVENMNNPVTKERMRKAFAGQNNPFFGKKHSKETKEKISNSRIGKYKGKENPFFGRKHSEDVRRHLSELAKNRGCVPILQYSKTGDFIKEWTCASFAGKTLGISPSGITACCRLKRKTAGGYVWKYKNDKKYD